ncbi:MAG: hypothetical protein ACJ0Q5_03775 [Candidatus Neomarinimicrobiota bacterium]
MTKTKNRPSSFDYRTISLKVGDRISQTCGIKNEGLKRLLSYLYILVLVFGILFFLGGVITTLIVGIDEYRIRVCFLIGLGVLLWTPVYLLSLMIFFQLFINPIIFIIEGFFHGKNK